RPVHGGGRPRAASPDLRPADPSRPRCRGSEAGPRGDGSARRRVGPAARGDRPGSADGPLGQGPHPEPAGAVCAPPGPGRQAPGTQQGDASWSAGPAPRAGGPEAGADRGCLADARAAEGRQPGGGAVSAWERLGAVLRREKAPEERPMVDYDEGFFERIRSRYERASRAVELLERELAEQPSRASDRVEQLLSELRRQRWHAEEAERRLDSWSAYTLDTARIWNLRAPEVDERGWIR